MNFMFSMRIFPGMWNVNGIEENKLIFDLTVGMMRLLLIR